MKGFKYSMVKDGFAVCCCVALLSSVVLSEPLRQRRQTTQNYVIDTLVVVDDRTFTKFRDWFATTPTASYDAVTVTQQADSKIREYLALMVHQANDRLATLRQHLNYSISLQLAHYYLNETVLQSPGDQVNSDDALETFQQWIVTNNLGFRYDHAILLTGYGLTGAYETSNMFTIQGRAYVGHMCNTSGFSSSVVEYSGGFQSVFYVAHEVAHSLGSRHDGEESINTCSQSDNYIMAASRADPTPDNKDHPWYFSTCSASAIDSNIKNIISNAVSFAPDCLSFTSAPTPVFISTAKSVAGQIYTADDQCQMMYGKKSRVCFGLNFGNLSDICTSMNCLDPAASSVLTTCNRHFAADGTSCGDKMWCRMGQCVYSDDAPELEKCPSGDSIGKIINQQYTCSEYTSLYPSSCYQPKVRDACCASCEKIRKDSEVCPYGDKVVGCQASSCESVFPDGARYAEQCCGTCFYDAIPSCVDVSTIDDVSCDVRVTMGGTQNCYNVSVAYHCCDTCEKLRRDVRDCEYGDKLVAGLCPSIQDADWESLCQDRKFTCCASCDLTWGDPDSGVRLVWTSLPVSLLTFLWICYTNSNYLLIRTAL